MSRLMNRRTLTAAAFVAVPALWLGPRAQAPAARRLTPGQAEGPFYPVSLPADNDGDLLRNGIRNYARGHPAWLDGQVLDASGKPVSGAAVEIWQCDEDGHYHHPGDGGRADPAFQGFGRVTVGTDGRFRFRTIRPAAYAGRTPHIHLKVRLGARELLTTQVYVQGEAANERDGLWRRLSPADRELVTVPFRAGSDGLRASVPLVVAA